MSKQTQFGIAFVIIMVVNILLACTPTLWFEAPITQTDGIYYYSIAKAWAQGDLESDVGGFVTSVGSVKDYPPALMWFYKTLLEVGVKDSLIYNGFFIALLLVLGNFFLYKLVYAVTNRITALVALAIATLNIRSYYMLFGGIHPTLAGISLGFIGLYFFYRAIVEKTTYTISMALALTILNVMVHFATGLYLFSLQVCILIGYVLTKHAKIELPHISLSLRKVDVKHFWPLTILIVPLGILAVSMLTGGDASKGTGSANYVRLWIDSLLRYGPGGYQNVWEAFPIFDGPVLFVLGIVGVVVLFFSKEWIPFTLVGGSWLYVILEPFFFPERAVWIIHYLHNFYPVITIMMGVAAGYVISRVWEQKKWIAVVVLVMMVGIQCVKLGAFVSLIEPAIDSYEEEAAAFIKESGRTSHVFFYDNGERFGWRNIQWAAVFAEAQRPRFAHHLHEMEEGVTYDAIMIGDKNKISEDDKELLAPYELIFENTNVAIYG